MTFTKVLLETLTIIGSELAATAIFMIVVILNPGGNAKATGLGLVGMATITSPFYWLLVVATVAVVVWLFRR
jgi:hypothetical protein